ncbi:MAG TPA: C4-dicarboxylate ABC transporter permease, partial [Rhodobacteraceae bacterium]|nr:C4-dicarboxylate ABC transporter permease [Paracoccaceae bacterium]
VGIVLLAMPVFLPIVLALGFDPIWFGIFLVIMVELAQITPPIGFNLFIIQGLTGTPIMKIAVAATPFFVLMCIGVVLLTVFPEIALWLPNTLFDK